MLPSQALRLNLPLSLSISSCHYLNTILAAVDFHTIHYLRIYAWAAKRIFVTRLYALCTYCKHANITCVCIASQYIGHHYSIHTCRYMLCITYSTIDIIALPSDEMYNVIESDNHITQNLNYALYTIIDITVLIRGCLLIGTLYS